METARLTSSPRQKFPAHDRKSQRTDVILKMEDLKGSFPGKMYYDVIIFDVFFFILCFTHWRTISFIGPETQKMEIEKEIENGD